MTAATSANRLKLDYRAVPARKTSGPIWDIHTHVYAGPQAAAFFEAARLYGVTRVLSMTPLEDVPPLRDAYGDALGFIAIPNWRRMDASADFRRQWIADLAEFRRLGARLCKFWMAPPMRQRSGFTVDHPFIRPVVDAALDLGFEFMIHVGDPAEWFQPGARYADTRVFGTKDDQYPQLQWLANYVAPRTVVAAHMAGSMENTARLQRLLDLHPNLVLDSSATKWIVRAVAQQPDAARAFLLRYSTRVLFGSDLVANGQYPDFDHYASRYWVHRQMWESTYRGESPIDDPDAVGPPQLAGLDLPPDVLTRMYRENARRLAITEFTD